jgi:hypothetical protein
MHTNFENYFNTNYEGLEFYSFKQVEEIHFCWLVSKIEVLEIKLKVHEHCSSEKKYGIQMLVQHIISEWIPMKIIEARFNYKTYRVCNSDNDPISDES